MESGKHFGFAPSKQTPFYESGIKGQYEEDKENQSQKNISFPQNKEKFDLQTQIHLATEKIDPNSLSPLHIYLSVTGMIESGECGGDDALHVKYSIFSGRDWKLLAGKIDGISQTSSPSLLNSKEIVWNFPFETVYMATNPMGWPQIIVTVMGPDLLGNSVVKGYGSVHFPTTPGFHERTIYLYKPLPMSWLTGFFGYLLGTVAEYSNPEKTIGNGEGREVTRVQSSGFIKVKFQVMERNMKKFGYST